MPAIFVLEQEKFFEPILLKIFGESFGIKVFYDFAELSSQIKEADLLLIDERFLDNPQYQSNQKNFQELSTLASEEFISSVLLTKKAGLSQKQLDRLFDFCDDNLSIVSNDEEIVKKIYKLLKRKKQADILKQSLLETGNLVHSALQLSGDLGDIFHFSQKHTIFENLDEFTEDLLEVVSNYRFKVVVRILCPDNIPVYASNTERVTELDKQVIESHVCDDRFVEFGVRIQINFPRISILIKNLPSKDDYQVTRIKDNMVYLLNVANHLLSLYEARIVRKQLREKISHSFKKLQKEKNKAQAATRSKSEFLANMSHEIRTPMNAVIGMTHLALQTSLNEKQKNYIQKAHISAENLLVILNDILDFSKIEAGKFEFEDNAFQLKEIINNTLNLITLKANEKSIQLSVKLKPNVPRSLIGDSLRISQILINLTNNAVKFTPQGGSISLSVELEKEMDSEVLIHFSVRDTGIGISPEQQQKLFQSFAQADASTTRQYGGTGLGLAISSKLVKLMKGKIWLDSEENKGSNFHFTILVKKQSEKLAETELPTKVLDEAAKEQIRQLKGKKILLVEDNEINQELAMELLMMNGMTVETAYDGKEAIDLLIQQNFDGVLMDCQMPVMDGYEATRQIRQQEKYKDLPIIAMTANAMKQDVEKVLAVGMNDHIAKPVKPDTMLITMAKWIKSRGIN